MRKIDWYYDFVSPYAYFGFLRLGELDGADVGCRPVLLAGLLGHFGQKGPAEIPSKRLWTYRWCTWWATRNGIPFRFPAVHPFNPLPYLRLAIAAGNTPEVIGRIFEALWTTGADPSDETVLAGLVRSLGVDPARLAAQDVKDRLRDGTAEAAARGVFGVPMSIVDGQLFWGADATGFVQAYLADPGVLTDADMLRLEDLPVGAARTIAPPA